MTEIAVRDNNTVGAFDENDTKVLQYLNLNPSNPQSRAVVAVARYYGLDPLLKHVIVIPKGGVYITRDGYLHVAHTSKQLDGIVVEQEPALSEDGKEWVARVSVYRKDMRYPFTYPGRYPVAGSNRDYAQEMALKAAEVHALRRAFNVTGLPAEDEQRPEQEPQQSTRVRAADLIGTPEPAASPEPAGEEEPVEAEIVETPEETAEPISGPQIRMLHALFGEVEWTDREDRLRAASAVARRELSSSKDLTRTEASRLIDVLQQAANDPEPAMRLGQLIAEAAGSEGGE
jgi:hypothetical protein